MAQPVARESERLSIWDSYLKYFRATRGSVHEQYLGLLSKFTQAYALCQDLHEDKRIVHRFAEYAEASNNPIAVFEYMKANGIGCSSCMLYSSLASAYEKQGLLKKALDTYLEGIRRVADASGHLQAQLDAFENNVREQLSRASAPSRSGLFANPADDSRKRKARPRPMVPGNSDTAPEQPGSQEQRM